MTKLHVEQRKIGLSILFVFAVVEIDKPARKMSLFWRYMGGKLLLWGLKGCGGIRGSGGRFMGGISMVGNPF